MLLILLACSWRRPAHSRRLDRTSQIEDRPSHPTSANSTAPRMSSPRKVAVVGSGLAGLTAAWLLQQEALKGKHVEVHVFEKVRTSLLLVPSPTSLIHPTLSVGLLPRLLLGFACCSGRHKTRRG